MCRQEPRPEEEERRVPPVRQVLPPAAFALRIKDEHIGALGVAEGIVQQHVLVGGHSIGFVNAAGRDHHDLREREGYALAQLIGPVECVYEELPLHLESGVVVACADART